MLKVRRYYFIPDHFHKGIQVYYVTCLFNKDEYGIQRVYGDDVGYANSYGYLCLGIGSMNEERSIEIAKDIIPKLVALYA